MKIGDIDLSPGCAEYPRDQWYVAAWSPEVTHEKMLTRTICGDPVVLYRTEAGEAVALFDRCPHRGMKLSSGTGRVVGDTVQCGYHGIRFDPFGRGVEVPSGGAIPARMAVHSYPVVERAHWLWVWMGDPARADTSLIPDHRALGLVDSELYSEPGIHMEVKANYLLPLENLVDATHLTYLHHGLIDSGNMAAHPYRMEVDGACVSMIRTFEDEPMPPMMRRLLQIKGERVNRTLTLTSWAPNLCLVAQRFVDLADPTAAPRITNLIIALTPGGPKHTHQFATFANSFHNPHPERFNDIRNLLMEDVVAIEEIQQVFDSLGSDRAPEVSVRADEGGIRTRRIIADMVQRERQASQQKVAA